MHYYRQLPNPLHVYSDVIPITVSRVYFPGNFSPRNRAIELEGVFQQFSTTVAQTPCGTPVDILSTRMYLTNCNCLHLAPVAIWPQDTSAVPIKTWGKHDFSLDWGHSWEERNL